MPVLSRTVPLPLYHQLKTLILRQIEAGQWKPGDRLPTEDELSERFQVSKITVRHALRDLSGQGYIRREQGRGTFVERPRMQQGPRVLTSFTEEMRGHGLVSQSRVLEHETVPASGAVAASLEIAEGQRVFRLRRVRLANGEPMALQTAFLPLDLMPGIEGVEFADASLYEILQSQYSLHPATARETYRVLVLERDDAELLGVRSGAPGMGVERVTSLADGRRLEYVHSVMRSDRYSVVVELASPASR